jgi:sugar phosphate isomerase/epimerase
MKVGLYSITYLGVWYDGPALTLMEVMDRAKKFGFDGIEIDGKRPHGNPMDLDCKARDEIRNYAAKLGLDIAGVASNNDFSSPVPEHRECQLLMVREQIKLAKDIGAPVVRLFGAWTGVTFNNGVGTYDMARSGFERQFPDYPWLERMRHIQACLKEAAAMAAEAGVTVALQNHGPIIRHWHDVLELVEAVDNPALQICLDAPMLISYADDFVRNAALTVGKRQVHSHFGGEFKQRADGSVKLLPSTFNKPLINYPVFLQAMKEIGYDGYFCYEFCHPAVNKKDEPEGIDFIDEQTQLALKYLRAQIAAVQA